MKCKACGSSNQDGLEYCEYCNAALTPQTKAIEAAVASKEDRGFSAAPATPSTQLELERLIKLPTLSLPRNPFRWWAFFFPIGYLAGWGKMRTAGILMAYFLAGPIVAAILVSISWRLARAVLVLWWIGILYYSYHVATRVDSLVDPKPPEFKLPVAIGFTVLYAILSGILTEGF